MIRNNTRKFFWITDRATRIPAVAFAFNDEVTQDEDQILMHAGYGSANDRHYVFLMNLDNRDFHAFPEEWGSCPRTMHVAHKYISDNWYRLSSGDTVDVRVILGES